MKIRAFLIIITLFCAAPFAQDFPQIAVYVAGEAPDYDKKALGTRMLATLANSGRYKSIDRESVPSFLAEIENEQVKQRSGAVDDRQISALSKRFGARYVCIVDVGRGGRKGNRAAAKPPTVDALLVSARVVDVETGETVFTGEAYSALKSTVDMWRVCESVVKNMFVGQAAPISTLEPEPVPEPPPLAASQAEAEPDVAPEPPAPPPAVAAVQPKAEPAAAPKPSPAAAAVQPAPAPKPKPSAPKPPPAARPKAKAEPAPEPDTLRHFAIAWPEFGAEPEPEPEPEYIQYEERDSPQPKPKPKNRASVGAGGFFSSDFGGGVAAGGKEWPMPYYGGGAYLYFDFVYGEIAAGLSGGGGKAKVANMPENNPYMPDMSRTYVNIGAYLKYPFDAESVKFFPLLGLDYDASISGKLKYADGSETPLSGKGGLPKAATLSAFWFKLGGGVDVGMGRSAYLRGELTYGWRRYSQYEKILADALSAKTKFGNGLTFKTGVGVKF